MMPLLSYLDRDESEVWLNNGSGINDIPAGAHCMLLFNVPVSCYSYSHKKCAVTHHYDMSLVRCKGVNFALHMLYLL